MDSFLFPLQHVLWLSLSFFLFISSLSTWNSIQNLFSIPFLLSPIQFVQSKNAVKGGEGKKKQMFQSKVMWYGKESENLSASFFPLTDSSTRIVCIDWNKECHPWKKVWIVAGMKGWAKNRKIQREYPRERESEWVSKNPREKRGGRDQELENEMKKGNQREKEARLIKLIALDHTSRASSSFAPLPHSFSQYLTLFLSISSSGICAFIHFPSSSFLGDVSLWPTTFKWFFFDSSIKLVLQTSSFRLPVTFVPFTSSISIKSLLLSLSLSLLTQETTSCQLFWTKNWTILRRNTFNVLSYFLESNLIESINYFSSGEIS